MSINKYDINKHHRYKKNFVYNFFKQTLLIIRKEDSSSLLKKINNKIKLFCSVYSNIYHIHINFIHIIFTIVLIILAFFIYKKLLFNQKSFSSRPKNWFNQFQPKEIVLLNLDFVNSI
jgi:hypothetical protein